MTEWISVKDQLPEFGKHVLTVTFIGNIYIGYLFDIGQGSLQWTLSGFIGSAYFHGNNFRAITHWMPLPSAPEESEE
jgi:hypothetical protein